MLVKPDELDAVIATLQGEPDGCQHEQSRDRRRRDVATSAGEVLGADPRRGRGTPQRRPRRRRRRDSPRRSRSPTSRAPRQAGAALDWALAARDGRCSGGYWLVGLVDARTPLLVADAQGVRIRLGRDLARAALARGRTTSSTPRAAACCATAGWSSCRTTASSIEPSSTGAGARQREHLAAAVRRPARRAARAVDAVVGRTPADDLDRVAGHGSSRSSTVTSQPSRERRAPSTPDAPRPARPRPDDRAGRPARRGRERPSARESTAPAEDDVADEAPSRPAPTPEPPLARARRRPPRASGGRRREPPAAPDPTDDRAARVASCAAPASVSLVEDDPGLGRPGARRSPVAGEPVEPLVLDDFEVEPADDPVIGPELAAARTRLGLSVDQLAERTRIRPHVIESIEVDDFEPCGGDFYARGHLRTLARVLGVDVAPLLASYDERYAARPDRPAPGLRGRAGHRRAAARSAAPAAVRNWSVLVAVVMALVLAWSIARLVMDTPPELRGAAPGPQRLRRSAAAPAAQRRPTPVPVRADRRRRRRPGRRARRRRARSSSRATSPSARPATLEASPPVRVQSTDGAVTVALDGEDTRRRSASPARRRDRAPSSAD